MQIQVQKLNMHEEEISTKISNRKHDLKLTTA